MLEIRILLILSAFFSSSTIKKKTTEKHTIFIFAKLLTLFDSQQNWQSQNTERSPIGPKSWMQDSYNYINKNWWDIKLHCWSLIEKGFRVIQKRGPFPSLSKEFQKFQWHFVYGRQSGSTITSLSRYHSSKAIPVCFICGICLVFTFGGLKWVGEREITAARGKDCIKLVGS